MSERIPLSPPVIEPVNAVGERPLWSVMIPVFDCIQFLPGVLHDVLAQAPPPEMMQIEVIDDCSTDGDVAALVKEIGKGRIGYFRQQKNSGSIRNFETCLRRSRGHRVHLLHGDDRILSGFYKEVDSLFVRFPEAGAVFTNYSFISREGSVIQFQKENLADVPTLLPNFITQIGKTQLIQPPAIVVKRDVYEQLGGFYAVKFGEDWEMWCRIAQRFPIAYSPKVLAQYRIANTGGISYKAFQTGENFEDIKKVIDIIQHYLPSAQKEKIVEFAKEHYSISCIRLANMLLLTKPDVALIQTRKALENYKSLKTYFWAGRFYTLYFLRLKQIRQYMFKSFRKQH